MAARLAKLLATLPAPPCAARLARCVALSDFESGAPPRYLFTSRRKGRCNPDGLECVYFSADESTATREFQSFYAPLGSEYQPKVTFFADLDAQHALNLADPEIRRALAVTEDDLFGGWRLRDEMTRLQRLGAALAAQTRISALLYPSAAAQAAGEPGLNAVVFRTALRAPNSLVILGPGRAVLERWP